MIEFDRQELYRSAAEIYQRKFDVVPSSTILIATAVDLVLKGCTTREDKAALLGRIAEVKAEMQPLESASPIQQETFDFVDAAVEAVQKALNSMN